MPFPVLVILPVIFLLFAVACMSSSQEDAKLGGVFIILALLGFGWFILSVIEPVKVIQQKVATVNIIDNQAIALFNSPINLNRTLSYNFKGGEKVKQTTYSQFYIGVLWPVSPTYEVVDAASDN